MRFGIVGAGMAGLSCAEGLASHGHDVVLLDKGRGPGGRMSTRRIDTCAGVAEFDHGAQYFTARDPGFRTRVDKWVATGCVAPWVEAGEDAYVGVPGMNAPLRQMAAGFAMQWGAQVTALSPFARTWRLVVQTGLSLEVDAVVLALPAEQAAALIKPTGTHLAALDRAPPTEPCWTAMLAFEEALLTPLDCLRGEKDGALVWAARNRSKPGRAGPEAWVLQAGAEWSKRYLESPPDWVAAELSTAFSVWLGIDLAPAIASSAHRWRYARSGREGSRAVWCADRRIGLCGDWLIGPRVEAAWLSGATLADLVGGDSANDPANRAT
jgi:predicted NAD/FAD-dependent oxidoreductase